MSGALTILIAFGIGFLFTLALAYFQSSRRKPLFETERQVRRRKATLVWSLLGSLGLAGACMVAASALLGFLDRDAPPSDSNIPTATFSSAANNEPARFLIPALGVDEKVVDVPVVDGIWDISRLGVNIGRLETTGRSPDDSLAMAFIGHVTVSAIENGPFADLWTLGPLAEVIYRSDGTDYIYAIQSSAEIRPDEVSKLYVNRPGHLLLVTCTDWNYIAETYDGRLLVDAVLTEQKPVAQ
jgi:sortase (surface protein transpeptidase)